MMTVIEVSTIWPIGVDLVYCIGVVKGTPMKTAYEIAICNFDNNTSITYAVYPKCKTRKGMDRQHERVVNLCVEALRDLPSGFWRRLTVTRVPVEQVAQGSL